MPDLQSDGQQWTSEPVQMEALPATDLVSSQIP